MISQTYSPSEWEEDVLIIKQGDITEEDTHAIVNAANEYLKHGGGLARAIVVKGGVEIQEESDKVGRVPTGQVAVTSAGKLKAKYVIHAVGPIWKGGTQGEEELLRSAVRNSLEKAKEMNLESISIPAISTGIFGYPLKEAARVILKTILEWKNKPENKGKVKEVRVVLFDEATTKLFLETLETLV